MSSKSEIKSSSQDATRQQLVEAAAEVFGEVGFHNATVREICRRAGANIAAVNYHFGDKEQLYAEVLRHAHKQALQKYPALLGLPENASAEKKLQAFVHSLLLRIFDDNPTACHGKLMSHEMIKPTGALDSLVEEFIRPMSQQLFGIVAEILGCPISDERVRRCAFSVVSQCMFYKHCNPVVTRLYPEERNLDAKAIKQLADHISEFSLTALKKFAKTKS